MINKGLMTSNTDLWYTPINFFKQLDREFNFTLDACADKHSYKVDKYFKEQQDGLIQDWSNNIVWCNPPYGREIKSWIEKSYQESLSDNTIVVMLIPSRTDTKYWHDYIFKYASEIRFVNGRLKFNDGKGSAPFPSAIIVFNKEQTQIITTYVQEESK